MCFARAGGGQRHGASAQPASHFAAAAPEHAATASSTAAAPPAAARLRRSRLPLRPSTPTWSPPAGPPLTRIPATHAPRYSLWLGGRVGVLAYAGGLYIDNAGAGTVETTGNYVTPGLALELDAGVRLARRYIPYASVELGLVGAGHRFDQTSTNAGTQFIGVGFRFLAGDVDSASFLSDISFGVRKFGVQSGGQSWSATGVELFRLGLGADIRLSSHFTLAPLITLSGGTLTDTHGSVSFGPNQGDGQTGTPGYVGGGSIPSWAQTTYYSVVVGCGAHFDIFGRYGGHRSEPHASRYLFGAVAQDTFEQRAQQSKGARPMAHAVFLRFLELRHGLLGPRHDEERVVTEAPRSTWRACDGPLAHRLHDARLAAVREGVDQSQNATKPGTKVASFGWIAQCIECSQQRGVVLRIGGAFVSKSSTAHARAACQRVDLKPRIVGNG